MSANEYNEQLDRIFDLYNDGLITSWQRDEKIKQLENRKKRDEDMHVKPLAA